MRKALALVAGLFGFHEVSILAAVALLAVGCWTMPSWKAGAFLVCGAIWLWIVLPTRQPFIAREHDETRTR